MSYQPKDVQERICHRLKISLGHLKKVMRMVEDGEYCINILHQSQAVQKALKEIDQLILENHLKTCVVKAMLKGQKDSAITEVMAVFNKKL